MNANAVIDTALGHLRRRLPGIEPAVLEQWFARNQLQLRGRLQHAVRPVGGDRIVTLNLGLGRDSFTMLCLLLEERLIAQQTLVTRADVSAVQFADTGHEWSHTYQAMPLAIELCRQAGLRWLHLRKPPREGEAGWQAWQDQWAERRRTGNARSLPSWHHDPPATLEERAASGYYHQRAPILEDYHTRRSVISVAKQDCTSNHKIAPMRRALEDLARERFGVETNRKWGADVRKGLRRPHLALIGYAADEGQRLGHEGGLSYVEEAYPLVEMGITKAREAAILERWHLGHVRKSGCRVCPYQPVSWYWALRETDPEGWAQVVEYERDALARNPRMSVLAGRRPLEEVVDAWRQANPDATVEAVLDKAYARCPKASRQAALRDIALHDTGVDEASAPDNVDDLSGDNAIGNVSAHDLEIIEALPAPTRARRRDLAPELPEACDALPDPVLTFVQARVLLQRQSPGGLR